MKRRLMYWWHLCNAKEDELIVRVYNAQKLSVHKSDWFFQLQQDLRDLNIELSDGDLKQMR